MTLIGTKIKHLRELKSITVKEMAFKLEMTEQGYSKIERGETDPSYSRLCQIAEALDEKIESIINFDPKQFFYNNKISTVNGSVFEGVSENEKRLYEETIILLKDKIKYLELQIKE